MKDGAFLYRTVRKVLDCEKYNPGEEATKKYLKGCGFSVIDTSKDPEQRDFYDFIGYTDELSYTFEAKYDNYFPTTRSIVFEDLHIFKDNQGR